MMQWKVSPDESGLKLAVFLKNKIIQTLPDISAKKIKSAIDSGCCRINGKIERFGSFVVGRGDNVEFEINHSKQGNQLTALSDQKKILHIDESIIAYNKPPGISSEDKELIASIRKNYPEAILLHRLDKDTTGVLLFARSEEVAKLMFDCFKQRMIKKIYLAIVDGVPNQSTGKIENYLGKLHSYQGQSLWGAVPREKGLLAITRWKMKQSGKDISLITCFPETGRTHQLRVHLSGMGHPILGDTQYGRTTHSKYHPSRMMLHAAEVEFMHPVTKQSMIIKSPIPLDFESFKSKI